MKEELKEIIENSKCPKCGGKLVGANADSTAGLKCSKCGEWIVVTTYFPDYYYDETKYSIFIKSNNSMSFEKLKYIAKKCQSSCINVKKELSINNLFFKKGLAWEIKNDIIELNKIGIEYEISPTFKYIFK